MIYTQQPWLWECGKAAFWLFQAIVGIEGKRFLFFLNFHMSGISIAFFGFDQTGRHRSPPGHTSGAPRSGGVEESAFVHSRSSSLPVVFRFFLFATCRLLARPGALRAKPFGL
ncbi:MAG: hypothetical protein IPN69_02145 [Acidobacteria bacterium]|nr:hypothetical protein [Acidobacteriota bacterium]